MKRERGGGARRQQKEPQAKEIDAKFKRLGFFSLVI